MYDVTVKVDGRPDGSIIEFDHLGYLKNGKPTTVSEDAVIGFCAAYDIELGEFYNYMRSLSVVKNIVKTKDSNKNEQSDNLEIETVVIPVDNTDENDKDGE